MRRTSLQRSPFVSSDEPSKEGSEKISSACSLPVKNRKMSTTQYSSNTQMSENNNRKESLKAVKVLAESSPEKEYDPYEHRSVKHPTTYFETLMHLMKGSMGTGILAMPFAFSNAGYLLGTVGTIFMGFLCTYTVHILVSSSYELCRREKKPSMTYPETAGAAIAGGPTSVRPLAKLAPATCNLFLLMYEIGSGGIYILFVASNLKDVVDQYQTAGERMEIRWYCLFILGPLILLNCIRSYKYLAPLITLATALTTGSFAIIFCYLFSDFPDLSERVAVAPVEKIPLYFATVVFAMEAIGVVLPLENEMAEPGRFGSALGVVNCAMVPITLLYTSVGLFGYLRYGHSVLGSITLSLPAERLFSQAVRVMLSIAIFFTHGLLLHPAIDIIWLDLIKPRVRSCHLFWEYAIRIGVVFLTFLLAVAVPFLELFISLIGALCMAMLGLMFPAVIETCTYWHHYSGLPFVLFLLKNFTIAVIAGYGLVFGVKTTVEGMIEKFSAQL